MKKYNVEFVMWREKNMKRYVKEFANDEMKKSSNRRKSEIQAILNNYERGMITDLEAIKRICDTYYDRL